MRVVDLTDLEPGVRTVVRPGARPPVSVAVLVSELGEDIEKEH